LSYLYKEKKPKYFMRLCWFIVNKTIFRMLIFTKAYFFKNWLLRSFGADIAKNANIYSSASIFAPWNLKVGKNSTIGPDVEIYNKAMVTIGERVSISQGAKLYTASHDINSQNFPLVTKPIHIGDDVWVAAVAFVGPGVVLGRGSVVGACSVVFKSVDEYDVVVGNPCATIKRRSSLFHENYKK